MRGDHARQGWGHFWAEGNRAFALVHEIVQLVYDFIAALGRKQFERLERRSVILTKTVTPGNVPPFTKNVLAGVRAPHILVRKRFGVKVAKTGQSFHARKLRVFVEPLNS